MAQKVLRETKRARKQMDVTLALTEEVKKHQVHLLERNRAVPLVELAVADLSPVPLALLSQRGVIISAGKPLFDLLQAPADGVLFHALAEFLRTEDVAAFFKFLVRCGNKRQTGQAEFLMAAGGRPGKPILLVVTPTESGGVQQMVFRAAFVDLSESQERDFGPRRARQDTRLMEVIDGIVWEADYPMRFTFVSRQAERILGFPPQQWLRDPDFWEKHIYHEDRERIVQRRALAVRQLSSHVLQYRMLTADRGCIWVKDSAVILAGAPGWTRMCGIITDITDLKHTQSKLKHANESLELAVTERTAKMEQSLEAMETLCYGIAHDLKAPIRGLQGFIGILLSDYQQAFDDDAKAYANRCQAALKRMGQLIEAVLAYGRLNHTLPELLPLQVKPIITRILESVATEINDKHAKIDVQMRFPKVLANPYLLEQVFTNLISNALKFSPPGVAPEISISALQTDSHPSTVRFTVADNGVGISPEFTKRMFGMFQKFHASTEYPGSGIGLAIVKRATELMNGKVGVISEPGHGSSFWIELPSASTE